MESLLNVFVETKCLQQRFFGDDRQALEPVCRPFGFGFFSIFRPRLTCVWPSISRKFLFLRNAVTGLSAKASAVFLFVWRRCQWALMIFCTGGWSRLYVVENGVLELGFFSLSTRRSFRSTKLVRLFWVSISSSGNPLALNFLARSSIPLVASSC